MDKETIKLHPTIVSAPVFNATGDALKLVDIFNEFEIDEANIFNVILSKRSSTQRREIERAYKKECNRSLTNDLGIEFGCDYEDFVSAIMTKPNCYLSKELHASIVSIDNCELNLIEIILPRTKNELEQLAWTYETLYETTLAEDLASDRKDHFRVVLAKILASQPRHNKNQMDAPLAKEQAQQLVENGFVKPDPTLFFELLVRHSLSHIQLVFINIESISKFPVDHFLKNELQDDSVLRDGICDIVQFLQSPTRYFARRLKNALIQFDSNTVTRIIINRSEIDLMGICDEYEKEFDISLLDDFHNHFIESYKTSLGYFILGNVIEPEPTEK